MQTDHVAYLTQMGIDCYQLSHPERLTGYQAPALELPAECKLLLVSPVSPNGELALLFERVLKSINISLDQARHIYPEQATQLAGQSMEWVWFAGCERTEQLAEKALTTPLLSEIDGNNQQRKALWQQICSY
ncbi:DNA polymerase III subunit psi [Vibrio scophthalmi]|uniref:DNA polymerase III subunit psi n=1 Tax=Vibrio scophthalmi TaxID=45658 RepID=A0A1B1NRP0_9VIBR|nr:DNA polymerase III subunit psi [Vibrio scophthalmi]ANS86360.1 DNA-directed DNA polymerase [Vibrio scophthalmi]ANU35473.1 DNA-directed DNA polymerase [Vibrio scophthalmi]ODS10326.1 DNA-directed DNA polymerase [Vibrio scophthalmi]